MINILRSITDTVFLKRYIHFETRNAAKLYEHLLQQLSSEDVWRDSRLDKNHPDIIITDQRLLEITRNIIGIIIPDGIDILITMHHQNHDNSQVALVAKSRGSHLFAVFFGTASILLYLISIKNTFITIALMFAFISSIVSLFYAVNRSMVIVDSVFGYIKRLDVIVNSADKNE